MRNDERPNRNALRSRMRAFFNKRFPIRVYRTVSLARTSILIFFFVFYRRGSFAVNPDARLSFTVEADWMGGEGGKAENPGNVR